MLYVHSYVLVYRTSSLIKFYIQQIVIYLMPFVFVCVLQSIAKAAQVDIYVPVYGLLRNDEWLQ